jgi:transcriptional regulator with XRE-family HTH domain
MCAARAATVVASNGKRMRRRANNVECGAWNAGNGAGGVRIRRVRDGVPMTVPAFNPVSESVSGTASCLGVTGGSISGNHRSAAPKAGALGEFLRARRHQVRPEDVGMIPGARRRVSGLRREELAMLAGISAEYYLRLEVGRDNNPSAQVVDALAHGLRLDVEATEYIHRLAGTSGSRRSQSAVETLPDGLDQLIDQFPTAAFVASSCLDVLAANQSARALSPEFVVGENFLRWRLLDPAARELYVNWDEAIEDSVRGLREATVSDLDDPKVRVLIHELSAASRHFRELWARADVGYRTGTTHLRHPRVGDIHLRRNRLSVPHRGGQHLLIYHAEPGSKSARALEELRSLSVRDRDGLVGV